MAKLAAASKKFLKEAPDYFWGYSFIFSGEWPGKSAPLAGQEEAKEGGEVLGGRRFSMTF
jgi:hypothetical protein